MEYSLNKSVALFSSEGGGSSVNIVVVSIFYPWRSYGPTDSTLPYSILTTVSATWK